MFLNVFVCDVIMTLQAKSAKAPWLQSRLRKKKMGGGGWVGEVHL